MKNPFLTLFSLLFALSLVSAQPASPPIIGPQPADSTTTSDALGRETPSGAVLGFLESAQAGNYKAASEYLQMSAVRRQSQGVDLATKLKLLMDRAFVGSIRRISTRPEGSLENGDINTQTVGYFSVNGEPEVPVVLVRVNNPNGGKAWLFSSETLSRVPDLYDNLQVHQIETRLPQGLVNRTLLGMPLWQWLGLLIFIPLAVIAGWIMVLILAIPRRLWLKFRNKPDLRSYSQASTPLLLFFSAVAHRVMASFLGLPLLSRVYYYRVTGILMAIGFFWLALRLTGVMMRRFRAHAVTSGRTGTGTLMVLADRLLAATIVAIGVLAILSILGFNLTTVLAGLGIGGLAIAFAAQKTLENLFGGVSVLADEVIRVGDVCRFGDRVGTVEDISLRSTRIRTADRSELSIPNGALATMNVENLTRRDKILFNPNLAIRYETTPDQLRYLLAEIRRMLYEHPKIETEGARVRLAGLDPNALTLEIFSYVLTADFPEFAAIREDLLLRIFEIVERAGTKFAPQAPVVFMDKQAAHDQELVKGAEEQVEMWRKQRCLPFPDYAPEDKAKFRGTIPYPPPESAVAGMTRG